MAREFQSILRLIFDHYEEALLLFCRSAGSSLEPYFDGVVHKKLQESIRFFRRSGWFGIDETLLGILISAQFDSYRRTVTDCPDRQSANAASSL